jgi:hypothetical protein
MKIDFDKPVNTLYSYFIMNWTTPQHTKEQLDLAGKILINRKSSIELRTEAIEIMNNWRLSHYFPLNTLHIGLRRRARSVDPKSLTVQRIKRQTAIENKLRRYWNLPLSEIQDIGGCRAIVSSVRRARKVVSLCEKSRHEHELLRQYNYIDEPKKSGYRSHHLVYCYNSKKSPAYNGLKIEMQIRSRLQHTWATAVEAVDAFTMQALKSSSGNKDWLTFFALMGSAMAIREGTPPVPNTPTNQKELKEALQEYATKLDIISVLAGYSTAVDYITGHGTSPGQYRLIVLDNEKKMLTISSYASENLEIAFQEYSEKEKEIAGKKGMDAVLVSVDSIRSLRRAYPNYFLDTGAFLAAVRAAIE